MRRLRSLVIVLACVACCYGIGINDVVFSGLSEIRFRLLSQPASGQIALIAIDPKSIQEMRVWPWPRRIYADLIAKLQDAEVADIAFDIDFSSASTSQDDIALAGALKTAGGSVLLPAFKQVQIKASGERKIHTTLPLEKFGKHAWLVTVNVEPEISGSVRHYRFGEDIDGEFTPSMASLLAAKFDQERGRFAIDFAIAPQTIPQFSFVDVLSGHVGKAQLSGKRVIIGGTAAELGDRFVVPRYGVMSGPLLQAMAAESILQNRALNTSGIGTTLLGLALLSLLCGILWVRTTLVVRVVLLPVIALAIEVSALLTQAVTPVMVDTSLILIAIGGFLVLAVVEEIGVYKVLATLGQRRFQTIAHSLGDGIICADKDGIITFCNTGAADMFGYRSDDVIGIPVTRLFEGELDQIWQAPDHEVRLGTTLDQSSRTTSELLGLKKDGSSFDVEICVTHWQVKNTVSFGVTIRDITNRKREEERIRYLAEHDTLTGLANRGRFNEALANAVSEAEVSGDEVAILVVDLDDFKIINDTLGHQAGDKVLQEIATTLTTCAEGSLVARMGGDEFTVVVRNRNVRQDAAKLAEDISQSLKQTKIVTDGQSVSTAASIGISIYPSDGLEPNVLLANADLALYESKARQGGSFAFYCSTFRAALTKRLKLEEELKAAYTNNEFELYYQPQVALDGEDFVGAEALIRWRHPSGNLVSPDEFMPIVNSSALSDPVADWVLETAVRQAREWELQGHKIRVGVNISPSQLANGRLPNHIERLLRETGLSPALLELELTENILIDDDAAAVEILSRIRAMGVGVAFDDFGTGYASMTYLKRFPLDRLKVDRSFVMNIRTDHHDAAIVSALIELCGAMNLSIIAEGIEDRESVEILLEMGCDEGQGYFFSRPVPVTKFAELLARNSAENRAEATDNSQDNHRTRVNAQARLAPSAA